VQESAVVKSSWGNSQFVIIPCSLLAVVCLSLSSVYLGEAIDIIWPPSLIPGQMLLPFFLFPASVALISLASKKINVLWALLLSALILAGSYAELQAVGPPPADYSAVSSNLKLVGIAVSMYASDNRRLPERLGQLTSGSYLSAKQLDVLDGVQFIPSGSLDFTLVWNGKIKVRHGDGPYRVVQHGTVRYTSKSGALEVVES
jgi:hypothetical protein